MTQPTVRYQNLLMDNARWHDVSLREGDIIISTPPKSGTTWMQMICALLIFQSTDFPRPLDAMSPWVDLITRTREDLLADLEAQRHRRFLKTHTPLDGLPVDDRVTYICVGRDPRDAAISWGNHMDNTDFEVLMAKRAAALGPDLAAVPTPAPMELPSSARDQFWAWVDNPDLLLGLSALFHHLSTFWAVRERPNVVLVHYDDLRSDLAGQMRTLAAWLGIGVAEPRWPELMHAATFDHMRRHATQFAPEQEIWHDPGRFFHRGTSGQWRDLLTAEDLKRYAARVETLAAPELSSWVHRGPVTAGGA